MRILELNIKNYRAFGESQKFMFQPNLTVIAGINGKGKTAILESTCLILSRLLPLISPAKSGYRGITTLDVHEEQEDVKISIKANCAGIPLDYSLEYNKYVKKINLTKLSKAVRDEIKKAYGDPSRADDQAPLVVYYTTDRAGYRFPKKVPEITSVGQSMAYSGALTNRTVDYKDLMSRIRVATSEAAENSNDTVILYGQKILRAINNTIELFLDGFSNLRVVENPLKLVAVKDGETLDIRQLSDGERSFIAMICDLSRRLALANPELDDPRLGAGVVFIDEIELHLHPKWQLEITEKLRATFPNIQFIVSTHSPFILQTIRQGELISLDKGLLPVEPAGKSLEEVAKYVMDIKDTEYSPRVKNMKETARMYLELAEEARTANNERREEIKKQLIQLTAPFTDNPAYIALLESKGML